VTLFNNNNLLDEDELILNLEVYKFVSRDILLGVLRQEYNYIFEDVKSVRTRNVDTLTEAELSRIEDKYDVLLEYTDALRVRIILASDNKSDLTRLGIELRNVRQLEFVRVTPVNFMELRGRKYCSWDYDILFKRLVLEGISLGATDVHIDVEHHNLTPKYVVKFRIGNDIEYCDLFEFDGLMNSDIIFKLISTRTNANPQDLNNISGIETVTNDLFEDKNVSLRVSATKVLGGFKCVCRIQTLSTVSKRIHQLGFDEDIRADLMTISKKIGGLTLITGNIRTGKNTTAFAIGNEMIQYPITIVDYSSPVEVLMPFTQVDYGMDKEHLMHLTRLTKKHDVNVAFINEIADSEAAQAMNMLVVSGVHVVTTTHVRRIWNLPHKLYEFYGKDFRNIISQMNICINQRMFNVQCPHCRNKALVSSLPELYPDGRGARYKDFLIEYGVEQFYTNTGCEQCKMGNLKGKVQPYVERLVFTDEVISDLLKFDLPFHMESHIKDLVFKRKHTLEFGISRAISEGKLIVTSLDSIL
jgi:type II secretory ATPase GspE/PulE/Tfp pilus assembly ATPase PilB-like protein